ncbi:uncharacterized protein METZ01_LOCUS303478, partial [marine metagenome]
VIKYSAVEPCRSAAEDFFIFFVAKLM